MLNQYTLLFAFAAFFSLPAYAANFNFLRDSVFTQFNDTEVKAFRQFIGKHLDDAKDQDVHVWRSPQSSRIGKLRIKFSFEQDQISCRRTQFILEDQSRKEHYQFDICKHGNQWRIEETAARKLTEADWNLLRNTGDQALTQSIIGAPFSWHNPKTHNAGVITVISAQNDEHRDCRQLAITVFDSQRQSSNGSYLMCRQKMGEWQREISATE